VKQNNIEVIKNDVPLLHIKLPSIATVSNYCAIEFCLMINFSIQKYPDKQILSSSSDFCFAQNIAANHNFSL
jgi:hypothetical protein